MGHGQQLDKDGERMEIRIIKARDIDELSEIHMSNTDERRISIPGDHKGS